jgi:hypothetical protein
MMANGKQHRIRQYFRLVMRSFLAIKNVVVRCPAIILVLCAISDDDASAPKTPMDFATEAIHGRTSTCIE